MKSLKGIPQPLYKYRCWEEPNKESQYQRRILTDNEVYLASANQFNDPFDASLPYTYKKEDLTPENIFLKLLEVGRERYPHLTEFELHEKCFERQNLNLFDDKQYLREFQDNLKGRINKEVGVLSLSSKKDKLLMWSHYSNSHQGFCVGLDKFVLFKLIGGVFGKVTYRSEFPKADLFDNETPLNLIQILTTKSIHWKYENEYRMTKLGAARKKYILPNEAILEIILGHKMSEEHKDQIMKLAVEKFPHAKVFQSQINDDRFSLDMIPILKM